MNSAYFLIIELQCPSKGHTEDSFPKPKQDVAACSIAPLLLSIRMQQGPFLLLRSIVLENNTCPSHGPG